MIYIKQLQENILILGFLTDVYWQKFSHLYPQIFYIFAYIIYYKLSWEKNGHYIG